MKGLYGYRWQAPSTPEAGVASWGWKRPVHLERSKSEVSAPAPPSLWIFYNSSAESLGNRLIFSCLMNLGSGGSQHPNLTLTEKMLSPFRMGSGVHSARGGSHINPAGCTKGGSCPHSQAAENLTCPVQGGLAG